jgi:hypothetical protein
MCRGLPDVHSSEASSFSPKCPIELEGSFNPLPEAMDKTQQPALPTTQLDAYDTLDNKAELMLSADAFSHFDSCKTTKVSCWTNLREDIRSVHHLSW